MSFNESGIAIRVSRLRKSYRIFPSPGKRFAQFFLPGKKLYREVEVIKGIDLEIAKGETVGIIGANGAGKSTLLGIIAGVLDHDSGNIEVNGSVSALLSLGTGFISDLSGRENVFLNAMTLGLTRAQVQNRFDEILEFAAIGDYIDQPIRTYSSGMTSRLAFSIAIHTDPEILIIDETLSVGDEAFQRKCFAKIDSLKAKGMTILFVSHSAGAVLELCDRAVLLAQGQRLLTGTPRNVVTFYQKLIYAASDKREQVLDEIRTADADLPEKPADKKEPDLDADQSKGLWVERFDEEMEPVSTLAYESRGAVISNVRITDKQDRQVNVLNSDGEYTLRYEVQYDGPASNVRFSTLLKTISGLELGALWTSVRGEGPEVDAGDVIEVEFPMKLPLREGTYFANAGATGVVHGEYILQHRIIDAIVFKIMPQAHGVGDRYVNLATTKSATTGKRSFHGKATSPAGKSA